MLHIPPWSKYPLTVRWLTDRHHSLLSGCPAVPDHIECRIESLDTLDLSMYENIDDDDSDDGNTSEEFADVSDLSEASEQSAQDSDSSSYREGRSRRSTRQRAVAESGLPTARSRSFASVPLASQFTAATTCYVCEDRVDVLVCGW